MQKSEEQCPSFLVSGIIARCRCGRTRSGVNQCMKEIRSSQLTETEAHTHQQQQERIYIYIYTQNPNQAASSSNPKMGSVLLLPSCPWSASTQTQTKTRARATTPRRRGLTVNLRSRFIIDDPDHRSQINFFPVRCA